MRSAVPRRRRRRSASMRYRLVIALAFLVGFVPSASSWLASTAANAVPSTNVSQFVSATITPATLAPSGCSTLPTLTALVTGSGNFTNTTSNALVLGSAAAENINDNGHNDCLVGGAGQDHVNGQTGDVCIVGPTLGAQYNSCTKK